MRLNKNGKYSTKSIRIPSVKFTLSQEILTYTEGDIETITSNVCFDEADGFGEDVVRLDDWISKHKMLYLTEVDKARDHNLLYQHYPKLSDHDTRIQTRYTWNLDQVAKEEDKIVRIFAIKYLKSMYKEISPRALDIFNGHFDNYCSASYVSIRDIEADVDSIMEVFDK